MESTKERRIALFIDFENLVTKTGIAADAFDLQPALDRLLERGKVVFRRAYCDWSRFKEAKENLHRLGVELVDVPASTRAGKNAADMRLTIDALELCYAREHIDTFVIASGDSDFVPLANKLRENDRIVIGLAVKESTSPHFVNACDEFIYMRGNEKHPRGRGDAREPQKDHGEKRERPDRGPRKDAGKPAKGSGRASPVVPELVIDVVQGMLSRATGPVNPSALKEAIVRKKPDFDERDYGFSTFSKLLTAMESDGILRRQQSGRQWYVLPPEAHYDGGGEGGESHAPNQAREHAHAPMNGSGPAQAAAPVRSAPAQAASSASAQAGAQVRSAPAQAGAPAASSAQAGEPVRSAPAQAGAPAKSGAPVQGAAATAPAQAGAPMKSGAPVQGQAGATSAQTGAPAQAAGGVAAKSGAPARAAQASVAAPVSGAAPARAASTQAAAPARSGAEAGAAPAPAPTVKSTSAPAGAAAKAPGRAAPAKAPAKAPAAAKRAAAAKAAPAKAPAAKAAAPAKGAAEKPAAPARRQPARRAAPPRAKPVEDDAFEEEIPDPD